MARSKLPPRLQRRRIEVHVGEFYRWLEEYYAKRGWRLGGVTMPAADAELGEWESRDVDVQIVDLDEDGRIIELEVRFRHVPSVIGRDGQQPRIGWEHTFAVVLPEGYPSDLKMRIVNLTETAHPRMMTPDKGAPACIFPNAELDLVLREVLFNLLFKPDVVRPPVLFSGEDHGYRPREMKWYAEYGPQKLHDELQAQWDARQRELAGGVTVRDEAADADADDERGSDTASPAAPFVIRGADPPAESDASPPRSSPPAAAGGTDDPTRDQTRDRVRETDPRDGARGLERGGDPDSDGDSVTERDTDNNERGGDGSPPPPFTIRG